MATLAVATAFVLFSCGGKKNARLTGKINMPDSTQVFLYDVMQAENGDKPVDTAMVIGEVFTFDAPVEQVPAGLYRVMAGNKAQTLVTIDETEPVNVAFMPTEDGEVYETTITGGKMAKMVNSYNTIVSDFTKKSKEIRSEYEAAAEDQRPAISEKYDSLKAAMNTAMMNLAGESKDNNLSLYIYREELGDLSAETANTVKEKLSGWAPSFAENPIMKQIKDLCTDIDKVAVGQPFVNIQVMTADSGVYNLNEIAGKGKPVLVDFWASWCPWCRKANPGLKEVYKRFHSQGLQMMGVSFDRDQAAWQKAIKDDDLSWPNYIVSRQPDVPNPAKVYMIHGIPANILINGEGIIVARNLEGEELESKIAELLK